MSFSLAVSVAFTTNPFAAAPSWTNLLVDSDNNSTLMSFKIKRGREHELDRIEPATATIVLNNKSGDYWPGDATSPHYPYILPLKRVKVVLTYSGTDYPLFEGLIDSWTPGWIGEAGKSPIMTLECTDIMAAFSRIETTTGWSAESSPVRVGHLLDEVPYSLRTNTTSGIATIQAEPVPTGVATNNVGNMLQEVNDAEAGFLFVGMNGYVYFYDRDYLLGLTSQVTVSDTATGSQLPYVLPEFAFDSQYIYNDIHVSIKGSPTDHNYQDTNSISTYGIRTYQQGSVVLASTSSEFQADKLAVYKQARLANPAMRVKSLKMITSIHANPETILPQAVQYEIPTKVTVICSQASINEDYYIQGMNFTWEAKTGILEVDWQLRSLDKLQNLTATHTATAKQNNAVYLTAHNAAESLVPSTDAAGSLMEAVGQLLDGTYTIWRSDIQFNLSGFATTNTATSGSLWVWFGTGVGDAFSVNAVDGVLLSQPMVSTNWDDFYYSQPVLGTIANTSITANAYNQIPLNTSGVDWIQSYLSNANARIALVSSKDISATAPLGTEVVAWTGVGGNTPPVLTVVMV